MSPSSLASSDPVLSLLNISKSFGGTRALVDGQLDLHAGEVTALIGENGAGKSTLVKILTGIYQPDCGVIRLDGAPVRIHSPADAQKLGISVIHQESIVFDDVSVAETNPQTRAVEQSATGYHPPVAPTVIGAQ